MGLNSAVSKLGRRAGGRIGVVLALLALSACGGSSSPAPQPPPNNVVISGTVTFDLVPVVPGYGPGAGLDYPATAISPARGIGVEFVAGTTVLAATTTDTAGQYALTVPANRTGFVRAKALSVRTGSPAWDFSVVDNTSGNALYALDGAVFDTGSSDSMRDLHAPSGWTGTSYGDPRSAAPFAILDTLYEGAELVLGADPTLALPALVVHWSPDNVASFGVDGWPDPASGEIGTSFYSPGFGGMFLLGAENSDTDEYDRHVILHELGHYLEYEFWRSDSVGGSHSLADQLDLRVAFSEGWGTAFSALAADDSIYKDASGIRQASAYFIDAEAPPFLNANQTPGWYSEHSVIELLVDLVDVDNDAGDADSLTLGFAAVYDVLTDTMGSTPALTSVFAFIDALKAANPTASASIDALLQAQAIDAVSDAYGSGESNDADSAMGEDVLPVYTPITIDGPAVNLCSTDEFSAGVARPVNALGSRRFLRFDVSAAGDYEVTVTATSIPLDGSSNQQFADPDLMLHQSNLKLLSEDAPSEACMDTTDVGWTPALCSETAAAQLSVRPYVLEIYEWTNTADADPTPPIGRACFDVTVTQL